MRQMAQQEILLVERQARAAQVGRAALIGAAAASAPTGRARTVPPMVEVGQAGRQPQIEAGVSMAALAPALLAPAAPAAYASSGAQGEHSHPPIPKSCEKTMFENMLLGM